MSSRSLIGAVLFLLAACGRDSTAPCRGTVQAQLAPEETTLAVGTSFVASVSLSACGGSQSVSDVVTWRSEDIAVAVVDTDGQVTGKSGGATRILATGQRYGALGRLDLLVYNPVNPTDAEARAELRYYIERVTQAAARQYRTCDDGTPNIYAGDSTRVEVGFHYWSQCDVGRQARGVTDWSSWSAAPEPALDNAIVAYGMAGVGDRDGPLTLRGYQFAVIEGEGVRNQWNSWRVFLYDYQTQTADLLNIRTDAGSISFGNPTIEHVQIGGRQALVMTLFVFLDGSLANENGSLVYYRTLP